MKIAIIGLGIAGLAIAARLARAGHTVDGFEQYDFMHARGSSHGDSRILRLTPGEGEAYVDLAARAAPLWRAWEAENGAPLIDWTGGLMAGPPGSPFVASCRDLSARHGRPAETVKPADVPGAMRFPDDWEIVRQNDCGVVHADRVRAFLIAHAQAAGARLHANTATSPLDALAVYDRVILAQGAWNAAHRPERLRVERRVVAWFKAGAALPVICVDDGVGVYGMAAPDGLYKIGLHAVGAPIADPADVREPDGADAALLSAHAVRYLRLDDPRPVRMARCLYTLTPDSHFLIAPAADPRALVFSACSGHGFKYAPAFGELALDWIEGRPLPAAFSGAPAAFTPLGG